MFILGAQRKGGVVDAFSKHREFLKDKKLLFPLSAYELATSDWYFDFRDNRCPHDSSVEELKISEKQDTSRSENVSIKIRLLNRRQSGRITLLYPRVHSYVLNTGCCPGGHCDWVYDEFRLSESNRSIHEIELMGARDVGRGMIEADDVIYAFEETHP